MCIVPGQNEIVAYATWPQVFKDEMKAVYERVVADAKTKLLIGVGTDEVL